MTAAGQPGLSTRVAWHAGLAWRSSRWSILFAFGGGLAIRFLLPVEDAWVAAAVAGGAAALALALILLGEARSTRLPAGMKDPLAALEAAGPADQVAHALARAALVLAAFAAGVGLGHLLGLGRA